MSDGQILVLGGTGKTGLSVVSQLRRRGHVPRVASRAGPQRFDWNDRATWAPTLADMRAVYVVTAGAAPLSAFVELAALSGVGRLVLLSARAWARADDEELLAAEVAVQAFGGEWTILRPTWFAQNFAEEPFLQDLIRGGRVTLPAGEGQVPFVDVEDIAAVAAAVLTEEGHAGRIYDLSGPRLLTFGADLGEYARATGRDLRHVPVSSAEFVARLTELGHPADAAKFLDLMLGWVRAGHEAHLSEGVEQVLGRAPTDFRDYLRRTASTGCPAGRGRR